MFLGQFDSSIGQEGQVPLPPAWPAAAGTDLIVTRGFDRCLLVFGAAAWQALAEKLAAHGLAAAEARQLRRRLFAGAARVVVDGDGRLPLPAALRAFAGLEDTAVLAGMYDCFEIWEPRAWTAVAAQAAADGQDDRWHTLGI